MRVIWVRDNPNSSRHKHTLLSAYYSTNGSRLPALGEGGSLLFVLRSASDLRVRAAGLLGPLCYTQCQPYGCRTLYECNTSMAPSKTARANTARAAARWVTAGKRRIVSKRQGNQQSKQAKTNAQATASTSNQFDPLQTLSEDEDSITDHETQRKVQIPPIVIDNFTRSVATSMKNIQAIATEPLKIYSRNNKTYIHANNQADHVSIVAAFEGEKMQFHTFTPQGEKALRYVIKGLPREITVDEIKEDLHQLQPIRVVQITRANKETFIRESLPLFMVEFPPATNPAEVTSITSVCSVIIKWDLYRRPKGPTQCSRCQQLGHGTRNCQRNPRCVKCAGDHLTSICTRQRGCLDPPKCANCSGPHTANFKGCEYFAKYAEQQTKRIAARRAGPHASGQPPPPSTQPPPPPRPPPALASDFPALPGTSGTPAPAAAASSWPSTQHQHARPRAAPPQPTAETRGPAGSTPAVSTSEPEGVFSGFRDIMQMLSQLKQFISSIFSVGFMEKLKALINALSIATDSSCKFSAIIEFVMSVFE